RFGALSDEIASGNRGEREIVAHADIVDNAAPVTELTQIAQQPGRCLDPAVVKGRGGGKAMRRDDYIPDLQHGMFAVAGNSGEFDPAVDRGRKRYIAGLDI